MAPVEEVAIVNCLGEVRTALAGLEAAAQASLRANEVRLHELELRTARECDEARSSAEDDARRTMQKAEALEARVEKLEEKVRSKKAEALELRALVDKMTLKLEAKAEQLLALEDRRTNGSAPKPALPALPATAAMDRQAAAEAAAAGHRPGGEGSSSTTGDEEEDAKPKAKDGEGRRRRRKRPDSAERSCSSEDSSPVDHRKNRHVCAEKEVRSQSRGQQRSVSSSRSPESRGEGRRRGGGSREPRSRQRGREAHSCDSRGGRQHGGGHRRDHGSPGRSNSRERSRSRRPWHQSGGKGKSGGKGRESSGLCIPFVMGKCHWGDKCRDRHPDLDDAKVAKDNLQNKLCRFGMDCRRKDCIFKHPDGKRRDKG